MRHALSVFLLLALFAGPAQSLVSARENREPRESVSRWETMDYGPFLSMTLNQGLEACGRDCATLKAVVLRFGETTSPACMAYDTETMRVSAAWSGGFIDFKA